MCSMSASPGDDCKAWGVQGLVPHLRTGTERPGAARRHQQRSCCVGRHPKNCGPECRAQPAHMRRCLTTVTLDTLNKRLQFTVHYNQNTGFVCNTRSPTMLAEGWPAQQLALTCCCTSAWFAARRRPRAPVSRCPRGSPCCGGGALCGAAWDTRICSHAERPSDFAKIGHAEEPSKHAHIKAFQGNRPSKFC